MATKKNKKLKIIILIVLSAILLPIVGGGIFVLSVVTADDYVRFDESKMPKLTQTLKTLTIFDDENRLMNTEFLAGLDVNALSDETINAFLVTEDKRFFKHKGVDLKRIIGATINNVKHGGFKEGASTLTQQLAKNVFLTNEKSLKRKINEVDLARQIEKRYTKNEILTFYLNTVYFGSGAYGLNSAAEKFFGKSPYELTVAQSAALAGLLKSPTNYSPIFNYDRFLKRKDLVLSLMYKNNILDVNRYNEAKNEKLEIAEFGNKNSADREYVNKVIEDATKILNIDSDKLSKINCVIKTFYAPSAEQAIIKAVSKDATLTKKGQPAVKSAIVIDNKTRGVKAFYGDYDKVFNDKVNPASTLKPLAVYSPALELGFVSPITPVLDEKTTFVSNYSPSNYKNNYCGWTTVRESVKNSLNVPAVKTATVVGMDNCVGYLNANGFFLDKNNEDLSLALGKVNGKCTLAQLANGYCTLANQGIFSDVSLIKSIKINGETVYEFKPEVTQVFNKQTAFLMTDMLLDVTKSGTAKKLANLPFKIAGKTGTNGVKDGNNSNALFCGFTSLDTFAFDVSTYDGTYSLDETVVGGNQPTALAKEFLTEYYQDVIPPDFVVPEKIKKIKIDKNALKTQQMIHAVNEKNNFEYLEEYFNEDFAPKACAEKKAEIINSDKTPLDLDVNSDNGIILLYANDSNANIFLKTFKGNKLIAIGSGQYVVTDKNKKIYTFYAELNGEKSREIDVVVENINIQKENKELEKSQNSKKKNTLEFWRKVLNFN